MSVCSERNATMPRRLLAPAVLCLLVAVLMLTPLHGFGQTVPVNGNLVVVGHMNACTTGPTSTPAEPPTAYSCSLSYAITALQTQACYGFVADIANTGAATINVQTLGAKTIKKVQGGITTDLIANDIRAGALVHVCYDGTNMQCQNCDGTTAISAATAHGLVVATGATTAGSLGVATNGQLPIGSTGADPVLATLTGTTNQIAVATGAGSITLSIPSSPTLPGTTTGTFSGNLTGNALTATALAT